MYFVIRGQSRESQAPSGMIHYENQDMLQVTKHDIPNAEQSYSSMTGCGLR
ncbi:hypothetical protein ANCCAN_04267 [Ancylostoma caninum]|uniref:Uncharacterized protein n=1 Tax=Ancylostoma caninum TaxID=29170 RepID=A0A368GZ53_ANCCA|nr:hypothetical protein ANCCAN_04267 [Ancylostoma caninum]